LAGGFQHLGSVGPRIQPQFAAAHPGNGRQERHQNRRREIDGHDIDGSGDVIDGSLAGEA
jgi:hypothetical protein